ncbi:hypothetical protein E2562_017101 [Oryza meyeriana var. granulata]|uniref:Uncharacterized protein n=1 Tax=Oryza meyeriana var. granulata TaxID=110450 RepID=A0A6G1DZS1_9ORYZ|nr:hypothetical protein E2562_017101 [Oryza meyeriana var. granulata]
MGITNGGVYDVAEVHYQLGEKQMMKRRRLCSKISEYSPISANPGAVRAGRPPRALGAKGPQSHIYIVTTFLLKI